MNQTMYLFGKTIFTIPASVNQNLKFTADWDQSGEEYGDKNGKYSNNVELIRENQPSIRCLDTDNLRGNICRQNSTNCLHPGFLSGSSPVLSGLNPLYLFFSIGLNIGITIFAIQTWMGREKARKTFIVLISLKVFTIKYK